MIEHELIERCRRGERSAQQEIYIRTADRIYRLLVRVTGTSNAALDLTQETYVRAFTRIGQFNGTASFDTWLCRIAVNEALQHRRRNALAAVKIQFLHAQASSGNPNITDTQIDVQEALQALPDVDRIILLLRYQDGMDYQTIGQVTDSPPGTVSSRLNRAREKLRGLLRKSYAGREEKTKPKHPIEGKQDDSVECGPVPPARVQPGAEP